MMHMHDVAPSLCACTALRKAARALTRHYDEHLAPFGLSIAQFAVLRHIARGQPIALSTLAEQLAMDRTTLYRALRPIEASGWIRTEAAPRGHVRLARLTDAGANVMHAAEPAWEASQAALQAGLGDDGWARLHDAAADVLAMMREARS
jgi:DNA-binding MarR family transcriptional regulator